MDSLQKDIFRSLSANALLRKANLGVSSVLHTSLPRTEYSIHDAKSDVKKLDDLPDVMYEQALLEMHSSRRKAHVDCNIEFSTYMV